MQIIGAIESLLTKFGASAGDNHRSYYKRGMELKSPARKCRECGNRYRAAFNNRGFEPGHTKCPGCGSRRTHWLDA